MADDITIPGTGSIIATDEGSGARHMQIMKLAISSDGGLTLIPADAANGLDVDVTRVQGNVTVVQGTAASLKVDPSDVTSPVSDAGGSLTVDAPVGTPVFVRLSDGSSAITALPVTDNGGALSIDDGGNVITVDGTVAATQSGTWNIGTLTSITNAVTVQDGGGNISIDDGGNVITVDGTVSVTQGTAAAVGAAWPMKITDGTDTVTITTVGSDKALDVNVVQSVGSTSQADKTGFTEGTGTVVVMGAVRNDTPVGDPADNEAAALRMTADRSLWTTLYNTSGAETGVSGTPLRVDPTNTTHQDVNLHNAAGSAFTQAAGLPVHDSIVGKTIQSLRVTFSASQSNQTLITPASGKKFVVTSIHVKVGSGGAGTLEIYDDSKTTATTLVAGTYANAENFERTYPGGRPLAAADNVLKYDTGSGAAGDLVVFGYDSD